MADIEIGPLSQRLSDEEIEELTTGLDKLGAPKLPRAADDSPTPIGEAIDDDALAEFLDRVEAHDLACEIYLPMEFEGRLEVAELRVGSAAVLIDVLEEMRDELDIVDDEDEDEDEDEDDEDEDDDRAILDGKLRVIWRLLREGAQAAIERGLPLLLQP